MRIFSKESDIDNIVSSFLIHRFTRQKKKNVNIQQIEKHISEANII